MASTNLYKKFGKTETKKNRDGGYKNVILYAPVETFASVKQPTASPSVLGDTKKVTTADTFNTDEGYISMLSKLHSVTSGSESVGDPGAKVFEHSFEGIILGDSPEHLEQTEGFLNDGCIWLVKDQDCINTSNYVRFGDDCTQPEITITFTGNTTATGLKEYKIVGKIRGKKVFYSSTVTEKP